MSAMSAALRHGIAAARAQQFDRARPLLEQAVIDLPDDPLPWMWLAMVSATADAAIPCLRKVLTIDPSYARAREVLANLLVTEAKALATAGNYADARPLAMEASQLCSEARTIWRELAALTDDPVERINALRYAVEATPGDPLIQTRLRQALLARGVLIAQSDRAEARARFREAAALDPSDPRVFQALANLADTHAERLHALRDLVRAAPDHARGRADLRLALIADARALADAGSVDDACERWREAIAVAGGDVELWVGLAAITPDQQEATRAVDAAYALAPTDPRVLEAIDRLRGPEIDPAMTEPPADAFDRFSARQIVHGHTESADAEPEQIDQMLGAIAELEVAPPSPATAPAPEPMPAPQAAAVAPRDPVAVPSPVAVAAAATVDEHPAEPLAQAVQVAGSNGSITGSAGHTIMIVDDSPTIRKILGLSLERAGYKTIAEADGESAIARLADVVPDVILLDIAMPRLDGYEVCKRIKQDPRTAAVPIVMLSGKDAYFDKVKGHMAGATEYLTKPFETPAVLSVVSSFCQPPSEVTHG